MSTYIEFKDFENECLDLLLSVPNIDVNIINKKGDSVLDIALNSGQNYINKLLPYFKFYSIEYTKSMMHQLKALTESNADIVLNNKKKDMLSVMLKLNLINVIRLLEDKKRQDEKNIKGNYNSFCAIA